MPLLAAGSLAEVFQRNPCQNQKTQPKTSVREKRDLLYGRSNMFLAEKEAQEGDSGVRWCVQGRMGPISYLQLQSGFLCLAHKPA